MNKNCSPENVKEYRRLKGIAQRVIKDAASSHWENFCGTLDRTTKLSTVWSMIKRMNGVVSSGKVQRIVDGDIAAESDKDKADLFAKAFARISSDNNYSGHFILKKHETAGSLDAKLKEITVTYEHGSALNDSFTCCEVKQAIREVKSKSAPGDDRVSYTMLKHLPRRSLQALVDLYNEVWIVENRFFAPSMAT